MKEIPYNQDAEEGTLGSLLLDGDTCGRKVPRDLDSIPDWCPLETEMPEGGE